MQLFRLQVLPNTQSSKAKMLEYIGRVLLATAFIFAFIGKVVDTAGIQAMLSSVGFPVVFVWPAAAVDITIASALIAGISWRLIMSLAALYCIGLGLLFHLRPESPDDLVHLAKNLSIAGGLLLLALRSKN